MLTIAKKNHKKQPSVTAIWTEVTARSTAVSSGSVTWWRSWAGTLWNRPRMGARTWPAFSFYIAFIRLFSRWCSSSYEFIMKNQFDWHLNGKWSLNINYANNLRRADFWGLSSVLFVSVPLLRDLSSILLICA